MLFHVSFYCVDSCLIYHSWLSLSTYTDNTDPSNPPNGIYTIMRNENKNKFQMIENEGMKQIQLKEMEQFQE